MEIMLRKAVGVASISNAESGGTLSRVEPAPLLSCAGVDAGYEGVRTMIGMPRHGESCWRSSSLLMIRKCPASWASSRTRLSSQSRQSETALVGTSSPPVRRGTSRKKRTLRR